MVPLPDRQTDKVSARRLPPGEAVMMLAGCQRIESWASPAALRAQFEAVVAVVEPVPVLEAHVPWGLSSRRASRTSSWLPPGTLRSVIAPIWCVLRTRLSQIGGTRRDIVGRELTGLWFVGRYRRGADAFVRVSSQSLSLRWRVRFKLAARVGLMDNGDLNKNDPE